VELTVLMLPGKLRNRLAADHLVRNSLYLVLSSGLQAALGFAFWIVTARLFSLSDVGRASALISAAILMAYLALLGLNRSTRSVTTVMTAMQDPPAGARLPEPALRRGPWSLACRARREQR